MDCNIFYLLWEKGRELFPLAEWLKDVEFDDIFSFQRRIPVLLQECRGTRILRLCSLL